MDTNDNNNNPVNPVVPATISVAEYAEMVREGRTINLDGQGRVRVTRIGTATKSQSAAMQEGRAEPGISLVKRRAWY